jgi:copper chaperone
VSSQEKAYFKFAGRHDRYSKSVIAARIDNIKGIRKIEINFITNIIMVEFDATLITKQHIRKRLLETKSMIDKYHW